MVAHEEPNRFSAMCIGQRDRPMGYLFGELGDRNKKSLYVEREMAHLDANVGGTIDYQTATVDIADYLKQGGQAAGHRELWQLLKTIFKQDNDTDQVT